MRSVAIVACTFVVVAFVIVTSACGTPPCTQTSCPINQVCDKDLKCVVPTLPHGEGEGSPGEGEGEGEGVGEGEGEGEGADPACGVVTPLDPERIYALATLTSAFAVHGGQGAVVDLLSPNTMEVGFPCCPPIAIAIRPGDGHLVYKAVTLDAARVMLPDVPGPAESGAVCGYPSDAVANDQTVATVASDCATDAFLGDVVVFPDQNDVAFTCPSAPLDLHRGVDVVTLPAPFVHAGIGGTLLVDDKDGGTGFGVVTLVQPTSGPLQVVTHPSTPTIEPADAVVRALPGGSFAIAASSGTGVTVNAGDTATLMQIDSDGNVTSTGAYAGPASTSITYTLAGAVLASNGDLYVLADDASNARVLVHRLASDHSAPVDVFDESTAPTQYDYSGGFALFTGP